MKEKKKKNKKPKIKTVQSTQYNVPVKEIVNGVIVTKDEEYVKILEVLPTPFFLKSVAEQNKIYQEFASLLRSSPRHIQFKSVALPTNLSRQLEILEQDMEQEENENCKMVDLEYKQRLLDSQKYGVTRRFFIVIKYERDSRALFRRGNVSFNEAAISLESTAERISSILAGCNIDVIRATQKNPNGHLAEILYTLLNRRKSQTINYDQNLETILDKYFVEGNNVSYVPPTDLISPKDITYTPNRLLVDGMYYGFMFITSDGYPNTVWPGWLDLFVNFGVGVDVDVFMERFDKSEIVNSIRKNSARAEADSWNTSQKTQGGENIQTALNASGYLLSGLNGDNPQDFYYVTTLITVCDEDPVQLNYKMESVNSKALERGIRVYELKAQAEEAFLSVLPLCNLDNDISLKTRRNMLTEGAASFFPFTTFQICDDNGVYFGDDMATGSLAIVDLSKKAFKNRNGFIAGTTGAGKTYALSLLAIRSRIKHIPVMIISPEKADEFRRLCNALGGEFVVVGEGSQTVINPMEIFMSDKEADEIAANIDGGVRDVSKLLKKIATIKSLFQLIIPDMDIEEKQILDEACMVTYGKFGINTSNDSLWNEYGTGYKKMPTLNDLKHTIVEMGRSKRLTTIAAFLTSGSGSFLNGQTNVNLNNDFVVYALDSCSKEMMPIAIFAVMDYCWSRIKENRTKEKRLFIDEWWKMAFNPVAAEYSLEISKVIRAYGGGFWVATQQMSDVGGYQDGKYGKAVINNSAIKILMGMEDNDLTSTREMMPSISDSEADAISSFRQGESLFIAGSNRMKLRFVSSQTEHDLITTDRGDLLKIAEENKKKKLTLERDKELQDAEKIDEVLMSSKDYMDTGLISSTQYINARDEELDDDTDADSNLNSIFISDEQYRKYLEE